MGISPPKYQLFLIFLSFLLVSSPSMTQTMFKSKKVMLQIEPNSDLITELKKLIDREKKCDYYSPSLIWMISIDEIENGCILNISMQKDINLNHQYVGFFHVDKTLFIVSGLLDDHLFSPLENKELEFATPKKSPDTVLEAYIEDYSNWIYLFMEGVLTLEKEYLLPCN